MSYLVAMVVDDIEDVPELLRAWEEAGVSGVTILESSGLGRVREAGLRDDLPLMPSLWDLFANQENRHRTLLSVVKEQSQVDRLVEATQAVTGDLDKPHSGFLFVLPVLQAYGLGRKLRE